MLGVDDLVLGFWILAAANVVLVEAVANDDDGFVNEVMVVEVFAPVLIVIVVLAALACNSCWIVVCLVVVVAAAT